MAQTSPRMETAVKIISRLFVGQRGAYGQLNPEDGRGRCVKRPVTEDLIREHIYGTIPPVGFYPVQGAKTVWFCIDIDRDGQYEEAKVVARKILDAARPLIRLHPERSKGKGIHLWCFHEATDTWKSRSIGRLILKMAGVPQGQDAKGREVDIYPRQDETSSTMPYGNFVYAPWQGKRVREGWTAFLDYDSLEPMASQVEAMEGVEPVKASEIDRIVDECGLTRDNVRPIDPKKPATVTGEQEPVRNRATGAAEPGALEPLSDNEFARLVGMSRQLSSAVNTPASCAYRDWIVALVHMVPFADGYERAKAFSAADTARFKADGFNGFEMYWDSALKLYRRDHAVVPRWSQRVVDDWRNGALPDIEPISRRYGVWKGCLVERQWDGQVEERPVVMTNFDARIAAQEYIDDGTGVQSRVIRVEAKLASGRPLPPAEVPSDKWPETEAWISRFWGSDPIIWVDAGPNRAARVKEAISLTGQQAPSRKVITHTGWTTHNGQLAFLTNKSATASEEKLSDSLRETSDIRLPDQLERYEIPEQTTPEDAQRAYAWIERFLRCCELETTMPLVSAMFLAPLRSYMQIDLALAVIGKTGTRKSSLVAAILSCYAMRGFTRKNFPATFRSTANEIERVAFYAKDVPLVVDNYLSDRKGEAADKLQRLAHSFGDGAARGRMRRDETLSVGKPARGVVIITGEDLPQGSSSAARFYTVTRSNPEALHLTELGEVQDAAGRGELAPAMTHYVTWLAEQLQNKAFVAGLEGRYQELMRDGMNQNPEHGRLAEQLAWVHLGMELATKSHPNGGWKEKTLLSRGERAVTKHSKARGELVKEMSLTSRFLSTIDTAVQTGLLIGVEASSCTMPRRHEGAWGWYRTSENDFEGRTRADKPHPGVYVEVPDPTQPEWYICVEPAHIVLWLRENVRNSMIRDDSTQAIGNALDADGLLMAGPDDQHARTNRIRTFHGDRRWVWRIDGQKAWRMLGREGGDGAL